MDIQNPTLTYDHVLTWQNFKGKILEVVNTFQNDYSIVKDAEEETIVLIKPVGAEEQAIGRDQLLVIKPDTQWRARFEITNEVGRIQSFTELDRGKRSLARFVDWLNKAISGQLTEAVEQQKPKVDALQGILQLILLAVAFYAIFVGAKACMR